jgi:hypothetical protein
MGSSGVIDAAYILNSTGGVWLGQTGGGTVT